MPSVLLLTVDTLRPDYLSANGYERPTTPFLDSLLAESVYFEQAVAPMGKTTPALASLLTGAYPPGTGVRFLTSALDPQVFTLAQVLRSLGYRTLAVLTNVLLAPQRGLARGFEVYELAREIQPARITTARAVARLRELEGATPFFAWVHYVDPHAPYHSAPEIIEAFDPDYDGPFRLRFGYEPPAGEGHEGLRLLPAELDRESAVFRNRLPDRVNAHLARLYAADVRAVDDALGALVAEARRAAGGELLVVFTADHGESLGEHGIYYDHGNHVYNEELRVPLAIALPGAHPLAGPRRVAGWVSLVDVLPTLLELLDLSPEQALASQIEGRSLVSALRGEPLAERPVFAESGRSPGARLLPRRIQSGVEGRFRSVIQGRWKLVWTPGAEPDQAWELYDLSRDPGERQNLAAAHPERVARLRGELMRFVERDPGAPAEEPSARDLEALRQLGYVE